MIQRITEDDDGNTVIEMDEEGIVFLTEGLMNLLDDGPGGLRSTPAVWTNSAPWWKFWNRSGEPVVGEFRLRYIEQLENP
jgi:hypothetical protein